LIRNDPVRQQTYGSESSMKCPRCTHSIHFDDYETSVFCEEDENFETGRCLKYGFCPHCGGLIVVLEHGTYIAGGHEYDQAVESVHTVEVLYPKIIARTPLPVEVPEPYRKDFLEAAGVLQISPKASAAISRRLLQHLLHSEFNISCPSLAAEIDQFIQLPGI